MPTPQYATKNPRDNDDSDNDNNGQAGANSRPLPPAPPPRGNSQQSSRPAPPAAPAAATSSKTKNNKQQENGSDNGTAEGSEDNNNEPIYEQDKNSGVCCTCCGCCPNGILHWFASLNRAALVFFFLMFAASILFFAGAGLPLFQANDGSKKLWSAWYYCRTTNVTSSEVTSTVISYITQLNYKCQQTYLKDDVYVCDEVQSRMNKIGALHLVSFIFAVFGFFGSVATVIRLINFPAIMFICSLICLGCGGAAAAFSEYVWTDTLCSSLASSSPLYDSLGAMYFPLFNVSLSNEKTLERGISHVLIIVAAAISGVAFLITVGMCFFPTGAPKKKITENSNAGRNRRAEPTIRVINHDGNQYGDDDDEDDEEGEEEEDEEN